MISDFAIILAILIFCGIDALVGVDTPKLEVPVEFKVSVCVCVLFLQCFFFPVFYHNPYVHV